MRFACRFVRKGRSYRMQSRLSRAHLLTRLTVRDFPLAQSVQHLTTSCRLLSVAHDFTTGHGGFLYTWSTSSRRTRQTFDIRQRSKGGVAVAKRGRSSGSTLVRLAFYKARPVNRDTLRVVDYKPAARWRKAKAEPSAGPNAVTRPNPSVGKRNAKAVPLASKKKAVKPKPVADHAATHPRTAIEAAWRTAEARRDSAHSSSVHAVTPKRPSRRTPTSAPADAATRQPSQLKCSPCPRCGGRKSRYYACFDCGFSLRPSKTQRPKAAPPARVCPRCGARASRQHIEGRSCKRAASPSLTQKPKEALPEWERIRPRDDLFDRGMVVSGGGVGVGKRKRR
jgi:hypothetical protein